MSRCIDVATLAALVLLCAFLLLTCVTAAITFARELDSFVRFLQARGAL